MRICLYLDRSKSFRWHLWLKQALVAAQHEVAVKFSPTTQPLPKSCMALFRIEKFTYRMGTGQTAVDYIDPQILADSASVSEPFDVLINFAADGSPLPVSSRVMTPAFNGEPTVLGAIAAILDDQPVIIQLHDNQLVWSARPAMADRGVLIQAIDNVLSCATGLIVKTLATVPITTGATPYNNHVHPQHSVVAPAMMRVIETITRKAGRLARIMLKGHRTWAIAWRHDTVPLLDRGTATFRVLRNHKHHFYADPFPYQYGGREFVFVEDYDHAIGRGCISVAAIDGNQASVPRPVIEENYHLSYPCVFEHDGQIWMIPESGEARSVDLYRAVNFPYKWKREGSLLRDIDGYDATPFFPEPDRIWLFIGQRLWNTTGWDALRLMYARKLQDEWVAHPDNPVVLDATASRPAGKIFQRNGDYIRPVQDCSRLYGGAVRLCRIDRLCPDAFSQTVIGTIVCAGKSPHHGCHTYNYHGGLEVIDIFDWDIGDEVTAFYRPFEAPQLVGPDALTHVALPEPALARSA